MTEFSLHAVFSTGLVIFSGLLVTGCEVKQDVSHRLPTNKATGVVTLDGVPVGGATVIFHSVQHSVAASGLTDQNGVFQLSTYESGDGVVAGRHQVSIEKVELRSTPDSRGEAYPPEIDEVRHLHIRYADPKTSELFAEIGTPDARAIQFNLTRP